MVAWKGRVLADDAALKVLAGTTTSYPWVHNVVDDVGEHLVELLLRDPHQVPVAEVERAYSLCSDRARRGLLRLLALRGDDAGVEALTHLVGSDGPWDLLPVPSEDLLVPILSARSAGRLAVPLASVAWRRGWAQHCADMLFEIRLDGKLPVSDERLVAETLEPLLVDLVDSCNRAVVVRDSGSDVSRVDRRALDALLPTVALFPSAHAGRVLQRALGSADPRVSAMALSVMIRRNLPVAEDRVEIICRDPEARSILLRGLEEIEWHTSVPLLHGSAASVGEAALVSWLASDPQLGVAPDEIEFRESLPAPRAWGAGELRVYAFRLRSPHWSAERGWMIGAVGPFDPDAEFHPRRSENFAAFSLYAADYEDCIEGHVLAISDALVGERPDAAA